MRVWRYLAWVLSAGLLVTALVGGLVFWPPIDTRIKSSLDDDLAIVAPLHDVLPPSAYLAYLSARDAADLDRNIEYTLRLADGSVPIGTGLAISSPPKFGKESFEYRGQSGGMEGVYIAVRQCFSNGDCLILGESRGKAYMAFRGDVAKLFIAFLAGLLLSAVQIFHSHVRAGRDIAALTLAVRRLLEGDLGQRLPLTKNSDYATVTLQLNRLLERIEHLTFATRTVIDSTAHDLRTPLYRLRSRLEQGLLPDQSVDQMVDIVEAALHEIDGIEATLDALLRITLAESGSASLAPVNVAEVAADVLELYRPLAEDKDLDLSALLDTDHVVNGNAQLLAQAIANLLDNAIKYTPRGGNVTVRVDRRESEVVIGVTDSGPGIPAADRARAMERSRRLANAAGTVGSGLGLALVVAVARLHGGRLRLGDNAPGLVAELGLPS